MHRSLLAAVSFLTRLPVHRHAAANGDLPLKQAVIFFPLVGLVIGLFTCGVLAAANLVWPAWLAVIVALACEAVLTGALHEDAVADFFDAFGGGWTREDVLRILKDSRIGTYGVLALVFAVSLRGGGIYLVFEEHTQQPAIWITVVAASAMLGRWSIVLAMTLLPPVENRESLTQDVGGRTSWRTLCLSTIPVVPAAAAFVWFLPMQSIAAAVAIALALRIMLRLIHRKLGGITGDCLGCICYLTQMLLVLAASA